MRARRGCLGQAICDGAGLSPFSGLGLGLGLGKGVITSVPVGGVSGRLFAMVLDSQDLGYPPIFRDALAVGWRRSVALGLGFPGYGTFKSVKNAKGVSRERKVVETRRTSLVCSACSNYVRWIALGLSGLGLNELSR